MAKHTAGGDLRNEVGKTQPFESAEQEAYLNLVRTHAQLARQFDQLFRQYNLSAPQYNVLRIVAGEGNQGIHSETIKARMVGQDPDTTRLIDRLQQAGLVQRERLRSDRRCVVVTITGKGRSLLRKVNPRVAALHREQLGHLGQRQLQQLSRLLYRARHPETS